MNKTLVILILAIFASSFSFAEQRSLHTYVKQEIATQDSHVKKFKWNQKTFWFKRPETTKASWYYKFFKNTLSKIVPIPFLRPSPYSEENLLMQEIRRLRECEKLDLKCPRIVDQSQDWIVVSDVGKSSEQVMEGLPSRKRLSFTIKLLTDLQEYHMQGFIHGRASLKDILIDATGYMYFIDFEEDPKSHLSLSEAKARDIFFFLFSALPFLQQTDYLKLADYLQLTLEPSVMASLLSITKFQPLFTIFAPFRNHLGKDPKRFFITLDFLYELENLKNLERLT